VDTSDYIKECIAMFKDDVSTPAPTPASKDLFNIDNQSPLLKQDRQETFHSVSAKLLWVAKRGRPDIDPSVSFLCGRVKAPTKEDWHKLKRVLRYLNATIDEKRVIGAHNIQDLFTWVDASYAVHNNMRSHTGGCMSFGLGILHYLSTKQKLNVKSSTEAEIVGMSDYVPFNVWLQHFLECQGYKLKTNRIYQDNQSSIKMEKNGRNSCTGNSRHIHIRYFFTKDRVDKGEFTIEYCPTLEMLADFYTKPVQGSLFKAFRAVIMGWKPIEYLKSYLTSSEERVEVQNENGANEAKNIKSYADVVKNGEQHKMTKVKHSTG
jgi:hypothetical protein